MHTRMGGQPRLKDTLDEHPWQHYSGGGCAAATGGSRHEVPAGGVTREVNHAACSSSEAEQRGKAISASKAREVNNAACSNSEAEQRGKTISAWESSSDPNELIAVGPVYDQTRAHTRAHTHSRSHRRREGERTPAVISVYTTARTKTLKQQQIVALSDQTTFWPGSDAQVTGAQKRKRQVEDGCFYTAHIMTATSGTCTVTNMDSTSILLQVNEGSVRTVSCK